MEEKLKICSKCGSVCTVESLHCANCATDVQNQKAYTVKYAFVDGEHMVLEPIANTLQELLGHQDSFMRAFAGLFIIKFFEFKLTSKNPFAPIAVLLQTSEIGVYHPVRHSFSVIPPTQ